MMFDVWWVAVLYLAILSPLGIGCYMMMGGVAMCLFLG